MYPLPAIDMYHANPCIQKYHSRMAIDSNTGSTAISATGKPCGRSGLGKQADSKKKTAPAHSFSHIADRETSSKTFLPAVHNGVELRCRESPGAIYSVSSSLDKQVSKMTAPKFTFPKTERLKVCGAQILDSCSHTRS